MAITIRHIHLPAERLWFILLNMSQVLIGHVFLMRNNCLDNFIAQSGEQDVSEGYIAERFYAINCSGFIVAERTCLV